MRIAYSGLQLFIYFRIYKIFARTVPPARECVAQLRLFYWLDEFLKLLFKRMDFRPEPSFPSPTIFCKVC